MARTVYDVQWIVIGAGTDRECLEIRLTREGRLGHLIAPTPENPRPISGWFFDHYRRFVGFEIIDRLIEARYTIEKIEIAIVEGSDLASAPPEIHALLDQARKIA